MRSQLATRYRASSAKARVPAAMLEPFARGVSRQRRDADEPESPFRPEGTYRSPAEGDRAGARKGLTQRRSESGAPQGGGSPGERTKFARQEERKKESAGLSILEPGACGPLAQARRPSGHEPVQRLGHDSSQFAHLGPKILNALSENRNLLTEIEDVGILRPSLRRHRRRPARVGAYREPAPSPARSRMSSPSPHPLGFTGTRNGERAASRNGSKAHHRSHPTPGGGRHDVPR